MYKKKYSSGKLNSSERKSVQKIEDYAFLRENWKTLPFDAQNQILCDTMKYNNIGAIEEILGKYTKKCQNYQNIVNEQIKIFLNKGIRGVSSPCEDVQFLAVHKNLRDIEYIKNPTEEIQKFVLSKNPNLISFINNPSSQVVREYQKDAYTSHLRSSQKGRNSLNYN